MPRHALRARVTARTIALLTCLAASVGLGASAAAVETAPDAAMLRYPDIGPSHIVFSYANDLWIVPREGGVALPLASPPGQELMPRFSADGASVAFVGNYDGNPDLYVMPTTGGVPYRVTHHPSTEMLCDIAPNGDLVYFTSGMGGLRRQTQLFRVSPEGGLPEQLPVPYGATGAISPDGRWLAYTPHTRDFRTWKRYRGGMATDIWLVNLEDGSSQRVTDWEGTDTLPMWHGEKLYYLSDEGSSHRLNIWVVDPATGSRRQVTNFTDFDVKWPSIGPGPDGRGEIVFQLGSDLRVLDLDTEQVRTVPVIIPGDRPNLRPTQVDASRFVSDWTISPSAKRAALSGRGDIWTVPAEKGSPRNLTRTSGAFERSPSWSPDGRWIAYFSDESGEYELYVVQSDGKREPIRLTFDGAVFRYDPSWSPDSKHIVFTDKSGGLWVLSFGDADLASVDPTTLPTPRLVDRDPWANEDLAPSWSHDSRWLAYERTDDEVPISHLRLFNTETGEVTQVTSGFFNDGSPAFDRNGDWLYYTSARSFQRPMYGDIDTSFIYAGTNVLLAVPLRADVKSPFVPESDEETSWKDDGEKGGKGDKAGKRRDGKKDEGADGDANGDGRKDDGGPDEGDDDDGKRKRDSAIADDGVSGTWSLVFAGPEGLPPGGLETQATITVSADGAVRGSIESMLGVATITRGNWDGATKSLNFTFEVAEIGISGEVTATVESGRMSGAFSMADGSAGTVEGDRTAAGTPDDDGKPGDADAKEKAAKVVEIELEGFEARAIQVPVPPGNLGRVAVNDKGQIVYVRRPSRGASGGPQIQLFDPKDEKREEKTITGGGGFIMTPNGKHLLVPSGGSARIVAASAGASGKPVVTDNMLVQIDPRAEWRQIFNDAWRIQRDFFYDPNMHNVDWPAMRERYGALIDLCASREDLSYVISELISELNVGHAYYSGGDVENTRSTSVGLLGVDYELVSTPEGEAYRIARIIEGAPWDTDARHPLREPGVDVKEGEFLLAVNGAPVDPSKDPWAAFIGTGGRPITITVSDKPVIDESARDVVVQPLSNEGELRYRNWIEHNRRTVEERTDGRVGYIYVPDTGVGGQNDLVRQFMGQIGKAALIIDERWNGGGQIPTRFTELLNRPVTNYWARRDGRDWRWPPDSHQGPKCMLINGLAGSGGDAFPHYFREAGLGKLIGTRTWGGLVGISGNPGLIDGARMTVPTFAFYERDGTWGIEGHGVDPDIEVVDDPALMRDGGDPQLDAAIELMLRELAERPYTPPARPRYPDRRGMGIPDDER